MTTEVGGAIKAPNVQALAAATITDPMVDVPDRYIRPEINAEPVDEPVELPVIDFGRLFASGSSEEESLKLHLACEEWGFFQLVNHGISEELIEKLKEDISGFFKLPLEEKEEFAQIPNHIEGYGQAFTHWEERKLDWVDMLCVVTLPQGERRMRFWPTTPPTFRDTLHKYCVALKEVASCVLRVMATNLGLDPERFINILQDIKQAMRFNYYPPCPRAADKVLGISPHSDSDMLTLLLQVNDVHGLQIKKNGKWFTAEPVTGAFVVNVGDVLEILTNGQYKSIEHRALVHADKERISMAGFHSPCSEAMVGPLPELVKGGEALYETMNYEKFIMAYFAKQHGKSHLESTKIEK